MFLSHLPDADVDAEFQSRFEHCRDKCSATILAEKAPGSNGASHKFLLIESRVYSRQSTNEAEPAEHISKREADFAASRPRGENVQSLVDGNTLHHCTIELNKW